MLFAHDTECALVGAAALVNTADGDREGLPDVAALDAFFTTHGWSGRHEHTETELRQVRALRPRLRRATWGHGLATEGARALVRHAFDTVGVRRVWAQTMAVNDRSRAVMARAGLRYVRTFHLAFDDPIPGTEHGEVEYELRRDAWPAIRQEWDAAALRAR